MNNNDSFFLGKKFSYKTLWWCILLLLCIAYAFLRIVSVIPTNTTVDNVTISVGALLALFPLISEASFLGFSVKKEISELKADVKDEFINIRSEMVNVRMNTTQSMNPIFYNSNGFLSTEEIDRVVTEKIKQLENEKNASKSVDSEDYLKDISDDVIYLFQTRYILESKINQLTMFFDFPNYYPLRKKIDYLFNYKVTQNYFNNYGIDQCDKLRDSIIEVISICNNAIHVRKPKEEYVKFVQKSIGELLFYLDEMIKYFCTVEHVL